MGVVKGISADEFPKQGQLLGKPVSVCFNYDTEKRFAGVCIRDDTEDPGRCIFQLEDGRVVLATECMYSYNTKEELVEKLPEVGEVWRNTRRGILYTIVDIATWADAEASEVAYNDEHFVVYRSEHGLFVRSLTSWLGTNREGKKRFEFVSAR